MKKPLIIILLLTGFICGFNSFGFSQEKGNGELTKMVPFRGKVVDKNGLGIPKVLIFIYGTILGGMSQQDGSFEFSVPEDQPFGLLCWHPNYIQETFPVNAENKSNFTIALTESVNTIDFINKTFIRSQHKIDESLPKPIIKLEEEILPGFLGYDDFPEYPGGQNGFWQRCTKEVQILSVTNKGKSRLKGVYQGTIMISEKGFMELLKVDEPVKETQQKTLQNFFLSFGQWKPVKWRGKPLAMEFRFVIKFD